MAMKQISGFAQSLKNHECIKVFVGKGSTPFVVSRFTLCNASRYFAEALSPRFMEGLCGYLHFPEDNEDAWSVLLFYLYHSRVPRLDLTVEHHHSRNIAKYWVAIARTWYLGGMYELPRLQNEIVRAFMYALRETPIWWPETLTEILSAVMEDCPLQKLVLEDIVLNVKQSGRTWKSIEDAVIDGGAFAQLLECLDEYHRHPSAFPKHRYGQDEVWTARYLVLEERHNVRDANNLALGPSTLARRA